jgi:predicted amino acid racemase
MAAPRLEIDLEKIRHNAKELSNLFGSKGISITGVTKGVLGSVSITKVLVESGINSIGDTHIANIHKMRDAGLDVQYIYIRPPMMSEVDEVVKYADASLNSEISVIKTLSECAVKHKKKHCIILMVELGDLREGLLPSDVEETVEATIGLKGVELVTKYRLRGQFRKLRVVYFNG